MRVGLAYRNDLYKIKLRSERMFDRKMKFQRISLMYRSSTEGAFGVGVRLIDPSPNYLYKYKKAIKISNKPKNNRSLE